MKKIYILLTRSTTLISSVIHAATDDPFTHASIALDRELTKLYSFARFHPYLMFPAGLVREDMNGAVMQRFADCPAALYSLDVADEVYDAIKRRIARMLFESDIYRYNVIGLLSLHFGIPTEFRHHYFCSQFVAYLLDDLGAASLPKSPGLMRPYDLARLDGATLVYSGRLADAANIFSHKE